MKAWKRKLSMVMALFMLAGTLADSGFTVTAADDEGPLALKEGEEWGVDEENETVAPAQTEEDADSDEAAAEETAEEPEEAADADETVSDAEAESVETTAEDADGEETTAEDAEEEETSDDAEEAEEWEWSEELDDPEWPTEITKVTARAKVNGRWVDAQVTKGDLTREMDCIWPALYTFYATASVDGKEYSISANKGFGAVPQGHDLAAEWVLNTEDAGNPYYRMELKNDVCAKCGETVRISWGVTDLIRGDRPRCDSEVKVEYQYIYQLMGEDENGNPKPSDIHPFRVLSGELTIPATGVHTYMRTDNVPGWDWRYDQEQDKWNPEACFWCRDCNREIRYNTGDEELSLDVKSEGGIDTYTAEFKSDSFYNAQTGKMDRSVAYSSVKKFTANEFEISGVEDSIYTGSAVKFDNLWIRYKGKDLREGVDYKAVYKNNTNAGKASLTIEGKGRFTGKVVVEFNIVKADISTDNFSIANLSLMENGKVQKKASILYWNGKEMPKGSYIFEYNDKAADAYKVPGSYAVTVKPNEKNAKGKNFAGTRLFFINIMDKNELIDVSKAKLTVNEGYLRMRPWGIDWERFCQWDEEKDIPLGYKVMLNGEDISSVFHDVDIQVDDNTGKGALTAVADPNKDLKGKRYGGSVTIKVQAECPDISKLEIHVPESIDYMGEPIGKSDLVERFGLMIYDNSFIVQDGEGDDVPFMLNLGDNFDLTLKKNNKPGTMSVTIIGKRGYTGKVEKKISLKSLDLEKLDKEGSLVFGCYDGFDSVKQEDTFYMPEEVWYCKDGAVIPDLQLGRRMVDTWVDWEGHEQTRKWIYFFTEGKDYTVKYADNKEPGKKASVTVSATKKGCLSGKITRNFNVTDREIRTMDIMVQDVVLPAKTPATMKAFIPKKVVVKDHDSNKELKLNKDFTLKYYYFTYEDGVEDMHEFTASTPVSDVFGNGDIVLMDDGIRLSVMVYAVPGSGFSNTKDEEGNVYGAGSSYYIVKSAISAKEFKIKDQVIPLDYNGDYDQYMYFEIPGEWIDPWDCSDEEYKRWADTFFDKYPADCRVRAIKSSIKRGDKPGTASITLEVVRNGEMDYNKGCRGGFITVKFKVLKPDMVK